VWSEICPQRQEREREGERGRERDLLSGDLAHLSINSVAQQYPPRHLQFHMVLFITTHTCGEHKHVYGTILEKYHYEIMCALIINIHCL